MARFFLSHSSLDKGIVRRVAERLEEAGADIWLDEQALTVGDHLPDSIKTGIRECEYVLVFVSANSINRPWFRFEIEEALQAEATRVIPVLLDGTDIPILLKDILQIDISDDFDAGIAKLISTVTSIRIETTPLNEKVSVTLARRQHDGRSKRVASAIFSSGNFSAAFLLRASGHLPSAVATKSVLATFWLDFWKRKAEAGARIELSKQEIAYMILLSETIVFKVKQEIGDAAKDVGVAIGFAIGIGNQFGVGCVGRIGALHGWRINTGGDLAFRRLVSGKCRFNHPQELALDHIMNHPVGFGFKFITEEGKDVSSLPNVVDSDTGAFAGSIPDMVQLPSTGGLVALYSYQIHWATVEHRKLLQVCSSQCDGALVARRICQFGKPVTDECSSIVFWAT